MHLQRIKQAVSKLRSPSSSFMDDAGPPSLCLLVHHSCMQSAYFSIVELETPKLKSDTRKQKLIKKTKVVERQNAIHILEEPRPSFFWLFSSSTSSSTEDLYMVVPSCGFKSLPGIKFSFTTESFLPIKPPFPSGRNGHVLNLGGRIYFLSHNWYVGDKHNVFQFYDPDKDSWEYLEPFPDVISEVESIVATAVLCDTLLFNVDYCSIWAFDVSGKKWYPVHVEDKRCCDIVGEAVVVGDTIYALTTESFNLVVELSLRKQLIDGHLVFKCSLDSENLVRDLKPIVYLSQDEMWADCTRHLVHLGKDNFCLVQSCNDRPFDFNGYQDLKLTYIKLQGEKSSIVADFVHHVKLPSAGNENVMFEVKLCFSLPKCKNPVLKEGKSFDFDRFPDEYEATPVQAEAEKDSELDNHSSQANITDQQGSAHFYYPNENESTSAQAEADKDLKLEEGHVVSLFETEYEELKIRKSVEASFESALVGWKPASSDQLKSEGTGVLEEEDQVLLFESGLEEDLKIRKSAETVRREYAAVNEIQKLKLELRAVAAESKAAQMEFEREINRLRKEMEAQAGVFKRELNSLKKGTEARSPIVAR